MTPGRKPKPKVVHLNTGYPGKKAKAARSGKNPEPKRGMPQTPPHLTETELHWWNEFGKILTEMRVLTVADGPALEQLVSEYVEILDHRAKLKKSRFQTIRTTNGSKKTIVHPAQYLLSDAEKRFRAMLEQFGLTPAARSRVTVDPEDPNKPTDPASKYF